MSFKKLFQKFSFALLVSTLLVNSPSVFAQTKNFCKIDKCDKELTFEINDLQEELKGAEGFINGLKQLEIAEASITKAIQKLDELLQKGKETLTKMLEKASTTLLDDDALDEYWEILEDLEETADDQADYVMEYVEKHPELMEKFKKSMPQIGMTEEMMEGFEDFFSDLSEEVFSPMVMDLSESEKMIGDFLQDMKWEESIPSI